MLVVFGASTLWCFRVWEVSAALLMSRAMEPRASITEGWLYPFFKLAYISDLKEILRKQQFIHSCNEYLLSTYWLPGTVPGAVTALLFSCSVVSDSLWRYGLCGLPGSSIHGILQARILEWVAISFSRGSSWRRDRTHVSCISCIAGGFFTSEPPGLELQH